MSAFDALNKAHSDSIVQERISGCTRLAEASDTGQMGSAASLQMPPVVRGVEDRKDPPLERHL